MTSSEIWTTLVTVLLWLLAAILVILGILGSFLPGLAGAPLVFLGLFVAAWIEDFQKVGWPTIFVLALLTLLSLGIDILFASLGARRLGASKEAVIGAMVGTFLGLFFGLPGLILCPFLGAVIGEYARQRDLIRAGMVGAGTWLGLVLGLAGKVGLVFTMVGIFLASYFLW